MKGIINSRPLTYIASADNDLQPPRPFHLLCGSRLALALRRENFFFPYVVDSTAMETLRGYTLQYRSSGSDGRINEYLLQLRSTHEWLRCAPSQLNLGDVGIVDNDPTPLVDRFGRIFATLRGRDDMTTKRLPGGMELARTAQRVCRLEARDTDVLAWDDLGIKEKRKMMECLEAWSALFEHITNNVLIRTWQRGRIALPSSEMLSTTD